MDYKTTELENGIRVVHKQIKNSQIANIGIMLDIGSRDEMPNEQGLAHFWEHMAFKGTMRRNSYHIINRLESVGGELNAYTTKEKICFYATVLVEYLERAIELLVDIVFYSTFQPRQIDRERMVILEEISMYKDSPEDAIHDEFDELFFPGQSIGRNILGTEQTVLSFKQEHFISFINRNIDTGRTILSSVGPYEDNVIQKYAEKYLSRINKSISKQLREKVNCGKNTSKVVARPVSQMHVVLGSEAFAISDSRRMPLFLLTKLLGGPYMNSLLNLSLREKNGLVYSVEANFSSFQNTGLFSIYFATDPKHYKRSLGLIEKEVKKLYERPITATKLKKTKHQIMGNIAMGEENNNSVMLMMAKSLLDLGYIPTISKVFDQINNLSSDLLQEIAVECFSGGFSMLAFQPMDEKII